MTKTLTTTQPVPKDFLYSREQTWHKLKQRIWPEEFGDPVNNRKEVRLFTILPKNKELLRGFLTELERQKYKINRKNILIMGLAQTLELYGNRDISQATIQTISKDADCLQQKIVDRWDNETTILMRFQELKQFMKFVHGIPRRRKEFPQCVSELYIETKKGKTIFDLPSEEEVAELIRQANDQMYRAFYFCLYQSAGRFGEIANLKVKDVVFKGAEAVISIHDSKTDERVVTLMDNSLLAQYLAVHPFREEKNFYEKLFFVNLHPNAYGKPLNHAMVSNNLKKTARKTKLKKVHLHALRHWRATHLAKRGLSDIELKALLGHTFSSKATARYLHIAAADVTQSIRRAMGQETEMKPKPDVQGLKVCTVCNTSNPFTESICSLCKRPLGVSEWLKLEEERNKANSEMQKKMEKVDQLLNILSEGPFNQRLKEIMEEQARKLPKMSVEEIISRMEKVAEKKKESSPKAN